mmetsp:Transcript_18213/g.52052  ORF Transcript_18213/g.52052 Transcript_18213/m.52052 type:complete len:217 (+) Transcript_18213:278-928(+)
MSTLKDSLTIPAFCKVRFTPRAVAPASMVPCRRTRLPRPPCATSVLNAAEAGRPCETLCTRVTFRPAPRNREDAANCTKPSRTASVRGVSFFLASRISDTASSAACTRTRTSSSSSVSSQSSSFRFSKPSSWPTSLFKASRTRRNFLRASSSGSSWGCSVTTISRLSPLVKTLHCCKLISLGTDIGKKRKRLPLSDSQSPGTTISGATTAGSFAAR